MKCSLCGKEKVSYCFSTMGGVLSPYRFCDECVKVIDRATRAEVDNIINGKPKLVFFKTKEKSNEM